MKHHENKIGGSMTGDANKSERLDSNKAKAIYQPGQSPERDAWFSAFIIENHLDYLSYPEVAASPEQVRFMVYTEENERYYPCSDRMFEAIMNRSQSAFLQKRYQQALTKVLALVDQQIEDPWEKAYLESLIITKYQHETRDEIMIPSRLEKRLLGIYLKRTQIEDPYGDEKSRRNQRAGLVLNAPAFVKAFNQAARQDFAKPPATLHQVQNLIHHIGLKRLFALCVEEPLWLADKPVGYTHAEMTAIFSRPWTGNGIDKLFSFLGVTAKDEAERRSRKILWMVDESGEIMVDLRIIRILVKMGHKVIIVFKEGPLFTKTDFYDAQDDAVLKAELEGIELIKNHHLSKNELVKLLRSDASVLAISDGTKENINLLHASTTFARAFKEVDGVISRGHDQRRRFFDTHFQFTQDIFNIAPGEDGSVSIWHKARHPKVIKFSHKDLEQKAKTIIDNMAEARQNGHTVIFYSGIIGSLPGKIDVAKQVMSVFIDYLHAQMDKAFIINPSKYYEQGMDADDLMYMWEIVQRSGYIDIWRFQTYGDISQAFQVLGRKIPPEWVGKDATYSTGCTKEMKIAQEVQAQHPEMQIIGPAKERFMRRGEYAVGKMYDRRLTEACNPRV